jgi:hypothetical protein
MMISLCKERRSFVLAVTLFLSVLSLGGCTSIEHSYNTSTGFFGLKSYAWLPSSVTYGSSAGPDSLLEANVKVLADQFLGQKGFTKVAEKPDLLISMNYEPESSYGLQMLTLNIYKSEQKELIWRGTASERIGSISTDAASGDLRRAVQGILSKFPPK